ncbi:hypothetical protein HYH03_013737 [Edaphochlamys debaryana]|uniref:SET domain-containing protein n=1 Tax=Edaphochlamys debaryana TaxID=47281 RepID=A0A835XQB2_9CHLO|nr:hypothetical protein HYH03_013737 [Edaphochlamys debaryana]|eukprot:KAG2487739.1 hypothetical protein HYH03_013737 [Edaphochlamys debaryana]
MTGTTPTGGGGIGGGGGGGAGGGADRDGGGGAPSIGPARTGADAEAAEGNHAGAAPRPDASAAGADEGEDEEAGTWGEEDEGGGHDGEGEEDGDGDRDEDGAWGQEEDGQAVESSEPEPAPPEPCFDLYFLPGYPASAEAAAAEAVGGITLLQGGREVILLGSDSASENEQVEEVGEEEVEVDGGAEEQADLQDSDVQEVEPAAAERVTRPRCQALNTSWLRRRLSAAAVTAAAAAAACTGAVTGRNAAAAGPTSGGSGRARGAGAGAGASGGGSSAAVCVDEADVARWRRHWAQFPTDRETGLPVETGNVRFYGMWDPTTSAHATRQAGSGGPPVMHVSVTPSVLPGGWFHYSNRPWRSARPRGDCGGGGGSDGPEPVTTDLQTGFLQPCSCHPGTCGNEEARRALKLARARGACCALEVRPHEDRRRGLGVYAGAAGVAAGEYVAEYTGVLLGEEEAADREELYERHDLHFLFDVQPTANRSNRRRPPTFTAIDATLVGNVARFVNHSCDPNLEVVNVCPGGVKGESHHSLLFHCCRAIHPGREATISYYGRISDEWRTALRRLVPDAAGDGAAAAAASGAGAAGPSGAGSGPEGGAEGRGGARRGGRGSRGRGRGRRGRGRRGGGGGGRGGAAPVLGPLTREQALAAGYIECSCGAENCVRWLFVQGAGEGPKGPSQPTGTSEPGPEPQPDAEPDPDWNPDRSPDAGPSDSSDGAGRDKDWRPERKAARSSGGAEAAGGDGGEADGEGHGEGGAERRQGSSGSAGTGSGRVRKRRRD